MSALAVRSAVTTEPDAGPAHERIVSAALRCLARWGLAKTTVDDVAREAGVGRATVYRLFPGGRDALLGAVVGAETAALLARLDTRLRAAGGVEDVLVACVLEAGGTLAGHDALQYLLAFEPEAILPLLAFQRLDAVLGRISALVGPRLAPWIGDPDEAARVAEWLARIVLSYVVAPSPTVDLADPASVARLVRAFVLPGVVRVLPADASADLTASSPHPRSCS